MILTPASTSESASGWAAAVGTASTPTTMSSSSTTLLTSSVWRTLTPLISSPTLRRSGVGKAATPETGGAEMCGEVAGAEQRDVVLAAGAQDLADLRDQRVDVVADPALAELAEARQVAADLRRVHVRVLGQLLRGDRLLAHLARLREHLQIAREPRRDAE